MYRKVIAPAIACTLLGTLSQEATDVYHWPGKTAARENPMQPLLDQAAGAKQTVPEGMNKAIGGEAGIPLPLLIVRAASGPPTTGDRRCAAS
jgi:hypothetical protein